MSIWPWGAYPQILVEKPRLNGGELFCNQHSCNEMRTGQYCPQRRPGHQGVKSASKTCFCLRGSSGSKALDEKTQKTKWGVCDSKIYDFLYMILMDPYLIWSDERALRAGDSIEVVRIVILLACWWFLDVIMMMSHRSTMNWSDMYQAILRTHSEWVASWGCKIANRKRKKTEA